MATGPIKFKAHNSLSDLPRLDPDEFFRSKYAKAVNNASGLELFAFKVIPFSLLKSFVLTLDPTTKFRISPMKVTVVNRLRDNSISTPFDKRVNVYKRVIRTGASEVNYGGLGRFGPIDWLSNDSQTSTVLGTQAGHWRSSSDTTRRTRPLGSNYGEFEKFKFSILSPARSMTWVYDNKISVPGAGSTLGWSLNKDTYTQTVSPQGAWISKSSIVNLRNSAISHANTLLSEKASKMLAGALPTARRFGLVRSVIELKDVPRSVLSFKKAAFDLSQLEKSLFSPKERRDLLRRSGNSLKDLPNEWLSYWFGWRALYKDILDLVSSPQKAAQDVERLMKRSGKPTSFRQTLKFADAPTSSPLFSYEFLTGVYSLSDASTHTREIELRLVLNATFDFPSVDIPYFRRQLFLKKLGVYPSISDVYELTPWSWLLDWFTGLGNYLEMVEAVNRDPSLINYGFITAVVKGKHSTIAKYRTQSYFGYRNNPFSGVERYVDNWYRHTSTLEYEVQVRRDIPNVTGVSRTTALDSLSLYQKSILGAILSQRVAPR